jgi:hypothetical protein
LQNISKRSKSLCFAKQSYPRWESRRLRRAKTFSTKLGEETVSKLTLFFVSQSRIACITWLALRQGPASGGLPAAQARGGAFKSYSGHLANKIRAKHARQT